jgi:hypothetical protein
MIAYKCAGCNEYFDGKPSGIIYDNRKGKGPRLDICPNCMDVMMDHLENPIVIVNVDEEQED